MQNIDSLCAKIDKEYQDFITNIKSDPVDTIIAHAQEITIKKRINDLCQTNKTHIILMPSRLNTLCENEHILDELYSCWHASTDEILDKFDLVDLLNNTADYLY